jgi:virulence factor Mce-like protein
MRSRQGSASLVASPTLVGAVMVLVSLIAVFLAYNANKGLPFVPTYTLKAQLPSGAKLVEGNEVRIGGFRVGAIEEITPARLKSEGEIRTVAQITMKLDKQVEPLAADSTVRVRPRSALGLKYVEITPGRDKKTFEAGDTVPLRSASEPLEFEDVFSTFDAKTRRSAQAATEGYGDAFAGRGQSLNTAIGALAPFFTYLEPVMTNLSDPDTELDQFFLQIGRASAQAAPVTETQARLFTHMADTFAAISRNPAALQATIEKSPGTMETAIQSFRVQRPFLADFADLSRRLRPAVAEIPRSLPKVNSALRVGTPVLKRTPELNELLEDSARALEDLFENPNTLMTFRDVRTAVRVTRPAVEFVAPYQTVCNYFMYFMHPLGEHWSLKSSDGAGTVQNQNVRLPNTRQPNNYGTTESSRPVDVPPGGDPRNQQANLHRLYAQPYQPAIDAQGNADCQIGQNGYIKGPFIKNGRYGPGVLADGTPTGGNFPVTEPNLPGLSGGTYKSRQLGIDNLKDVP